MNVFRAYRDWRDNLRVFFFYLRKYRGYYAVGITSLVIVDTLEAFPPLLLKSAVDGITHLSFGPDLRALLFKIVAIYMAIAFVQGAMRYLWRHFIICTSMRASDDMRVDLFSHLTDLPPSFYQRKRVGDLVSLATNDVEAVRFALGPGALTLFDALFYFFTIPPIMLWISPKLTLVAFVPLIAVPFFARRMESLIQQRFREVQDSFSSLAAHCQEALAGVRIVKGSALESFKERELAELDKVYVDANLKAATTQATLTAGLESILSISTTLLFLMGGAYVIGERVSIGVFVAFQRYIQKLQWPMEAFGLAANIFQRSAASQARIDEVMAEKSVLRTSAGAEERALQMPGGIPEIEIRNLSFTFPGASRPCLQEITLKIPPGHRVGIAGGVGSGKSTLLACIAQMTAVNSGMVFFNGVDVTELPLTETRRRIAFVPQECFLFSRSVEDNILYGASAFSQPTGEDRRELARQAARSASIDAEALRLPSGYDTVLGERGTNISGGQRQRLTIARALARAPQVLILDDCMSAIDAETEARLVDGLLEASEGISLVIASHRPSSFRHLDWLVVLDEGRVAVQGKPEELLRSSRLLARLTAAEGIEEMDLLQ
jgi:ATP-binding cassette, subfamily B, multidrug efflux pump